MVKIFNVFAILTIIINLSCDNGVEPKTTIAFKAGPILFISDKSEKKQLYSMNEDGSDIKQLTNDSLFPIEYASWSTNGKKIAFTSYVGGVDHYGPTIYVMNADGTGRYKLLQSISPESSYFATGDKPTWSPNSNKIAFHRVMKPESMGNTELFIIDVNSLHEERLTYTLNVTEVVDCWSNSGEYLYYSYFDYNARDSDGNYYADQLARISLQNRTIDTLTKLNNGGSGAKISPNDSAIAYSKFVFHSSSIGQQQEIQKMNIHTLIKQNLSTHQYRNESVVGWFSSGSKIVYNAVKDNELPYHNPPMDIIIIDANGDSLKIISPFDYHTTYFYATSIKR